MSSYLNWSFDHNYHQEANCDYGKMLFSCLENNEQYLTESPVLHYSILPNFRFNHKCPKIQNQEEMKVGELEIAREKGNGLIYYDVIYQDSTSGSRVCLGFEVYDNPKRTMMPSMEITRSAVHEETVYFRMAENIPMLDYGNFSYCTDNYQKENKQDLIQIYSLFDSLPENRMANRVFSMVDKSGQVFENCQMREIGNDKIILHGKEEVITGYCLSGRGYPPSYWWVDSAKRVVIVSTILLTYVLG